MNELGYIKDWCITVLDFLPLKNPNFSQFSQISKGVMLKHFNSKYKKISEGFSEAFRDINEMAVLNDFVILKVGNFEIVEAGTKRFAIAVVDVTLAKQFFLNNSYMALKKLFNQYYNDPKISSLSIAKRAKIAIRKIIGNGSKSGIGFYETTDKLKHKFKRI